MPHANFDVGVLKSAAHNLLALRAFEGDLGRVELRAADYGALAAALFVCTTRTPFAQTYAVTVADSGEVRIALPAGFPALAARFLLVREAALRLLASPTPARRSRARRVADIVALCCLFPETVDDAVIVAEAEPLAVIRPLSWFPQHFRALLAARKLVLGAAGRARTIEGAVPGRALSPGRQACEAGKRLREACKYRVAGRWFKVARIAAEAHNDLDALARAWVGLGKSWRCRGSAPRATRSFCLAARAAETGGATEALAFALHDLSVVCVERGRYATGHVHAARALALYGPHHAYAPVLLHDVGYCWMEQGHHERALEAFALALPRMPDAHARLMVLSNMVRAAGAAGRREAYESAWRMMWPALGTRRSWAATRALLHAAHGALGMCEYETAGHVASEAEALAVQRGEWQIAEHAAVIRDCAARSLRVQWRTPPHPKGAEAFIAEARAVFVSAA